MRDPNEAVSRPRRVRELRVVSVDVRVAACTLVTGGLGSDRACSETFSPVRGTEA